MKDDRIITILDNHLGCIFGLSMYNNIITILGFIKDKELQNIIIDTYNEEVYDALQKEITSHNFILKGGLEATREGLCCLFDCLTDDEEFYDKDIETIIDLCFHINDDQLMLLESEREYIRLTN